MYEDSLWFYNILLIDLAYATSLSFQFTFILFIVVFSIFSILFVPLSACIGSRLNTITSLN